MNNKKIQIIKEYFKEITPYLEFDKYNDYSQSYNCQFKINSLNSIEQSSQLEKYFKYTKKENTLILDFQDSSIHDVYCGLNLLNEQIARI